MKRFLPVIHYLNYEQALAMAEMAIEAGADGVFLIETDGHDELLVPILKDLRTIYPDNFIGANFLSLDPIISVKEAIKLKLNGIWVNNPGLFSDHISKEAVACGKLCDGKIEFFGSVAFKTQRLDIMPVLAASNSKGLGWTTTTSVKGTKVVSDLDRIKAMSAAVDGELAIASGITPDNLPEYLPFVSTFLVSTGISESFHYFDKDKIIKIVKLLSD